MGRGVVSRLLQHGATAAALALAGGAAAQVAAPPQPQYSSVVDIVARSVAFDVLDARGRPVADFPAADVRVFEDGVERTVLSVERVAAVPGGGGEGAAAGSGTGARRPSVVGNHVLVALDPTTLGVREWRDSTKRLAEAAEALVALGPVDVVALTAPRRTLAAATTDPAVVRAALAAAAAEVHPEDGFYPPRLRFMRETRAQMEGVRPGPTLPPIEGEPTPVPGHDPLFKRQNLVLWLRGESLQLAAAEQRMLRTSLDRLRAALNAVPRPTVLVWVASGEPMSGEFIRSLLPDGAAAGEQAAITEAASAFSFWSELDDLWRRWADAGVRVVAWSPSKVDRVELGTADSRRQGTAVTAPMGSLAVDPLALFSEAATVTGGALVQDPARLDDLLESMAGRFVVTFQSDNVKAGWHELRIEVAGQHLTPRYPLRVLVPGLPPPPVVSGTAPEIAVKLAARLVPSDRQGSELVRLSVDFDLGPIRELVASGSEVHLKFRFLATPPGPEPLVREIDKTLPEVPPGGRLSYEPTMVVPTGTTAFVVEITEESTGAFGTAGPVGATDDAGDGASAAPDTQSSGFAGSSNVRIGEARVLVPANGALLRSGA